MKNIFLTIIITFALLITGNHLCFAQINPQNSPDTKKVKAAKKEKLKKEVENIGIGGKITVIKLDNKKFYGKVTDFDDEGFQILEVDLKTNLHFKYTELKKINKGDGERNLFTGKRANPQKGWLYGIALFGTLFVVLGIALSDKDF
jgi:hypothetical protein